MTARQLIPRFYELFMAKAPDVRTKFAGGKKRHDIPPRMYVYWVDSLMTTLHEVEPEFDSELERLWRGLLQITIDYMSDGYEADS